MANQDPDHAGKIKSLVEDLEQRIDNLKHFDAYSEVNSHCDELIGQVMLTIESAMKHLGKVQTRMINEINDYRNGLLDASNQKQAPSQKMLKKLSAEIEAFKTKATKSAASCSPKVDNLLERVRDLRRQMRVETFGGQFLRLVESDFLEGYIIGSFEKTQKDIQDDFAIKHTVLDLASPCLDLKHLVLGEVTAVLHLNDGNLAIGLYDGRIIVCDPVSNSKLFELGEKSSCDPVTALAQLHNGRLACGGDFGSISIWDLETKNHVETISRGEEKVLWLKVLSNGYLAACCAHIYIWDLTEKKEDHKRRRDEPEVQLGYDLVAIYPHSLKSSEVPKKSYLTKYCEINVRGMGVREDKKYVSDMTLYVNFELLSNGQLAHSYLRHDGVAITIWNPDSGRVFKKITLKGHDIESCTLLPTGDAVICRLDKTVEILSLQDQKVIHSFRNNKGPILAIKQQPASASLQFVHLKDPQLLNLDKEDSQEKGYCHSFDITASFSNDGKYVAVGSVRSRLGIWPLQP